MNIDAAGRIAVLIPCYNEEVAIGAVIAGFRAALPDAAIYVFDNNSRDRTVEIARAAGAHVRREARQGKGAVVRRMFADVEADTYVLVDGDGTYDAASAPRLVAALIEECLDMVCASRVAQGQEAYRAGHRFGQACVREVLDRRFAARGRGQAAEGRHLPLDRRGRPARHAAPRGAFGLGSRRSPRLDGDVVAAVA